MHKVDILLNRYRNIYIYIYIYVYTIYIYIEREREIHNRWWCWLMYYRCKIRQRANEYQVELPQLPQEPLRDILQAARQPLLLPLSLSISLYIYIYMYMHIHRDIYIYKYMSIMMCICIYIYIYTHTYVIIYIYIYVCMITSLSLPCSLLPPPTQHAQTRVRGPAAE